MFGLADYADGHCFQESKKKEQEEKSQYVGGASLNTDPDLMERLKKADEFKRMVAFVLRPSFGSRCWVRAEIFYTRTTMKPIFR